MDSARPIVAGNPTSGNSATGNSASALLSRPLCLWQKQSSCRIWCPLSGLSRLQYSGLSLRGSGQMPWPGILRSGFPRWKKSGDRRGGIYPIPSPDSYRRRGRFLASTKKEGRAVRPG